MARTVMTLYLEDSDIKLIIARGRQVKLWASVPLPPGLIEGGLIIDEAQVADKVRELINSISNIKGSAGLIGRRTKVIVGLSGRDSLYRVLSLPVLTDNMLTEAVNREAARVLPVPIDELYIAYQRIPGGENESLVFVAAFPKRTTDTLIRTLRSAGVTPRVLDLAPLALCSLVNEPQAVIVDVSVKSDSLNIVVIKDRVPQVIRSLALQSDMDTLLENMPTISEELSRTIAFYNSSHQADPIDAEACILVSGDLVDSPETWSVLTGRLNSKVAILPSVIEYPEGFPIHNYIINLGLAAKELSLEKEPGNALSLYHLGYAYGMTGDHGKEVQYYEKAIALGYSRDAGLYYNLGMAYGELNSTQKAISAFKRALEIDPIHDDARKFLNSIENK